MSLEERHSSGTITAIEALHSQTGSLQKAPRNGRPQHPAKPVRGIRPTKARSGISKG